MTSRSWGAARTHLLRSVRLFFILAPLLLTLPLPACSEPAVTAEATPQPSMSADLRSLEVRSNEPVAMASGLSVVLPESVAGTLYYGDDPPGLYAELLLAEPETLPGWEGVALLSLADEAREMPMLAPFERSAELLAEDRHVKVLWGPYEDQRWLMIVTRLPQRLTGVLWHQLSSAGDADAARTEASTLWREFSVQGAALPIK